MVAVASRLCNAGTSAEWAYPLALVAGSECQELQMRPQRDFAVSVLQSFQPHDRLELVATDSAGRAVGALVCVLELADPHVGVCLSALFHFVLPKYRGRGLAGAFLRGMVREARARDIPCIAYSHRTGPWSYNTKYRKV